MPWNLCLGIKEVKVRAAISSKVLKDFLLLITIYTICVVLQNWKTGLNFVAFRNALLGSSMLAVALLILSFLPRKLNQSLMILFIGISIICFLVDLICFYIFGTTLNLSMLMAIFETTHHEAQEFLETYFDWMMLCLIALSLLLVWGYQKYFSYRFSKRMIYAFYVFCCFGCINLGYLFVAMWGGGG